MGFINAKTHSLYLALALALALDHHRSQIRKIYKEKMLARAARKGFLHSKFGTSCFHPKQENSAN